MVPPVEAPSARRDELLDASYRYVLEHGMGGMSLRPLARAIGSSPRVLLYLFGSKEGLVRDLLARARAEETAVLERLRTEQRATDRIGDRAGERGGTRPGPGVRWATEAIWTWLAAPEHRGLLTLWVEAYGRSLVEPDGPWAGFAARTVHDWLTLLDDLSGESPAAPDPVERTLLLAVLRGALLDLLATGDVDRTTAAVRAHLDAVAFS